jgi:hypothetical protein
MDSYTIRVKTLVPATHQVSVVPSTTSSALKQVVATITSVPAHRQRLIWRGRVMEDAQTMEQLGERPTVPAPAAGSLIGGERRRRLWLSAPCSRPCMQRCTPLQPRPH